MADTFGDLVAGWVPIAEPGAHARNGWLGGGHPPHVDDRQKFTEALEALHLANFDAARRLRGLGRPVAAVHDLSPLRSADVSAEADTWRRMLDDVQLTCWVDALRDGSLTVPGRAAVEQPWFRDAFDLIGISYTHAIGVHGDGSFSPYPADARVGPLGFAPWSDGLAEVLHRVAELLPDQPLLVAAHGVATDDDRWRTDLLRALPRARRATRSTTASTCAASSTPPASTPTTGGAASRPRRASSTVTATPSPVPRSPPRSLAAPDRALRVPKWLPRNRLGTRSVGCVSRRLRGRR